MLYGPHVFQNAFTHKIEKLLANRHPRYRFIMKMTLKTRYFISSIFLYLYCASAAAMALVSLIE